MFKTVMFQQGGIFQKVLAPKLRSRMYLKHDIIVEMKKARLQKDIKRIIKWI